MKAKTKRHHKTPTNRVVQFEDLPIQLRSALAIALTEELGLGNPQEYSTPSSSSKFRKICRAVVEGDISTLTKEIDFAFDVNRTEIAFNVTLLHAAAIWGQVEAAKHLLKAGAKIDAQDLEGVTPLYQAVRKGHHAVVEFLLEQGAAPNLSPRGGGSPLGLAIHRNDFVAAKLLRKYGAKQ